MNHSTERQIAAFLAKYTPEIAASLQACRTKLHALFPRGYELVYDNYNALVFGFAPSERTSEAVLSIAGYPRWLTLFFLKGTTLDDPEALLQGGGAQVRGIQLGSPEDIDKPAVRALIDQARKPIEAELAAAPPLSSIVKSVSAKQRPRRPRKQK
ncbi:MAG TPA: DUF1801 domain-containing protein [Thermoanaerobaculia bacterium]|nr:DUF1801 domain-containing protein [Thermoanaerobaculia bacterium]